MLIQPADDGYDAGTTMLLPAWPCNMDVAFKLHAPLSTTVELEYVGGTLARFSVDPPARAAAMVFAGCVSAEAAARVGAKTIMVLQ